MSSGSIDVLVPIAITMALAVGLFVVASIASKILSPFKTNKLKSTPYECGEEPQGTAWSAFNVRFYVVGLIFIIFDVESLLMFPVATIFKKLVNEGHGVFILLVFLSFVSVLIEGIAYCWKKGDLDWVKSFQTNIKK